MSRVAIVTGASSGIGEATARLLADRGWRCILVARREDRLRALASEIDGEVEVCDLGNRGEIEVMAARVLERHPAIELLVNNAGRPARGTFATVDLELVDEVMRVNYLGGVIATRAFLPGLDEAVRIHGRAHIVNLVSVAGTVAFAPAGAYAASKHAQLAFSRSLAGALKDRGISVHAVLPGFVETEGFPQKGVLKSALLRRFVIDPPVVARAVVKSVERDRREITVPWFPYRQITILQALFPGFLSRFVGMSDYRTPEAPGAPTEPS